MGWQLSCDDLQSCAVDPNCWCQRTNEGTKVFQEVLVDLNINNFDNVEFCRVLLNMWNRSSCLFQLETNKKRERKFFLGPLALIE